VIRPRFPLRALPNRTAKQRKKPVVYCCLRSLKITSAA
jgi:hypothetical protein